LFADFGREQYPSRTIDLYGECFHAVKFSKSGRFYISARLP
jgi:hypothetical protein